MSKRWIFVERVHDSVHVWFGPAGVHLFRPLWHSRFDWCRNWRRERQPS